MKDVFVKLRIKCSVCRLGLKILWSKIVEPFLISIEFIKRFWTLLKVERESEDRWERHVRIMELKKRDELVVRREQFHLLRTELIGAFYRTSICACCSFELQEQPNEVDESREEFQKKKEELVSLVEKLSDYEEITFDENIKNGIINWEFEKFKNQEELINWGKNFSEYICTLDII